MKPAIADVDQMEEIWGNSLLKWTVVICSVISLLGMVMGMCISLYRKIRHGSSCPVNCWFCNATSRVLYTLRNSWTCPSCKQYNGFAQDGGYNKRIAAQYLQVLNPPVIPRGLVQKQNNGRQVGSSDNGFCAQCNLNQELKIFQLASFVPSSEANFDKEIDDERNKLEKIYELCSSCKKTLKAKLARAARNLEDNSKSQIVKSGKRNGLKSSVSWKALLRSRKPEPSDCTDAESRCSESSGGTFHSTASSDKTTRASSVSMEVLDDDEANGFDEVASLDRLSLGSPPERLIAPSNGCSQCMTPRQYGRNNIASFSNATAPGNSMWGDYPLVCNSHLVFGKRVAPSVGSFGSGLGVPHSPSLYHSNTEGSLYRSSSVASIFGGKSPLPPSRLSAGSTGNFGMNGFGPARVWGLGLYYHNCFGPAPSPLLYSSFGAPPGNLFTPHLSRASSQSSGFVSRGLHTPSPKPPAQSVAGSPAPSALSASAANHDPRYRFFEEEEEYQAGQTARKSKSTGAWSRSNEFSRFGPTPPTRPDRDRLPERRSPRMARAKAAANAKSCYYSSDSEDDVKPPPGKGHSQSQMKKRDSQGALSSARAEKGNGDRAQSEQTSVAVGSTSSNSRFLTGWRSFFYCSVAAGSLFLNLIFLSWLAFGFELQADLGYLRDLSSEYVEWMRGAAQNVTVCVRSHAFV